MWTQVMPREETVDDMLCDSESADHVELPWTVLYKR